MAPFTFTEPKEKDDLRKRLIEGVYESDFVKHVCLFPHLASHLMLTVHPQLYADKPENALLPWIKTVEVLSVERPSETTARVVYRFKVLREYLNPSNTLHGGMSGGLYDTATSWMLRVIGKPGFWMNAGVSRSLNITFLRPAAEGEVLLMDCEVSLAVLLV